MHSKAEGESVSRGDLGAEVATTTRQATAKPNQTSQPEFEAPASSRAVLG